MSCRYELKFFSQKFIDDSDAMVQYIGLPLQGLPGTSIDVVVLNPPETKRAYSSTLKDDNIGILAMPDRSLTHLRRGLPEQKRPGTGCGSTLGTMCWSMAFALRDVLSLISP